MDGGEDLKGWETRDELLAAEVAESFPLSGSQLARMHRAGLIDRPVTRSLGRGRGKASLYPPGTRDRLKRVLELRREIRSFNEISWRLWWEDGGPVPKVVRARLLRVASDWERDREELSRLLGGEDMGDPAAEAEMDAAYKSLEVDRAPASLGRVRRNVGRSEFATVFRVFAEVASGRFEGFADTERLDEESRGGLFERALGIDRARVDHLAGTEPWFEGSSEHDMLSLSTAIGERSLADLADAADVDLDAARQEIREFWRSVLAGTSVVEQIFGSAAFGFGTVSAVFRGQPRGGEAFFLLMWLALREDPRLREGMAEYTSVEADALALETIYNVFVEWREAIPAFAEVLSDGSLAASLKDRSEKERFDEVFGRLWEEHATEVERFLIRHPELAAAMQVFETEFDVIRDVDGTPEEVAAGRERSRAS